jgi:predicted metal-dependent peptidase
MWVCPAFTHIFYTMLNNANSEHIALFTKDVPIAATDGSNLLVNPETFFKYSLHERLFICSHEILHCILNHLVLMHGFAMRGKVTFPDGSALPYSPEIMNRAMDYVINDMLVESKVGTFNKDWLHDTSIATAKDSVVDTYRKVFDDLKGKGQIKVTRGVIDASGVGNAGQFDQHLPPGASQGKNPVQASKERDEGQWQTELAAAVNSAKAQGKLPAGLERLINEVLNPKVDWREHIAALFARKVGSGSFDWRRADRRLIVRDIYAPGRSGFGAGTVVVGVDTSGSIGDKEVATFFGEMSGILEDVQPKRLVVMWCDAKVHRTDDLEEAGDLASLRSKKVPGGGGTSFVPVFDEIDKMGIEPDALVYMTDGMGCFPKQAPRYTVIWGSIYPQAKYPFGDVVDLTDIRPKR